jgi:ATP dependent DNA ligase domain
MKRRDPFDFVAFDVLAVNGRDVRKVPLVERKKILRAIVSRRSAVMLMADHVRRRGRDLFAEVCRQDLEGIVAKRADGVYDVAALPAWLKIKNPSTARRGIDKNCSRGRLRRHLWPFAFDSADRLRADLATFSCDRWSAPGRAVSQARAGRVVIALALC